MLNDLIILSKILDKEMVLDYSFFLLNDIKLY